MFAVFSKSGGEKQYHVGHGRIEPAVWKSIHAVQADGHELEHIRRHFKNIPMTDGRVVSWTGSDASFIVRNIKL